MSFTHRQGHECVAQSTVAAGSGLSDFTEQPSHPDIALAGFAALPLPAALMIAGTETDPGSQTFSATEWAHDGSDFDQEHGRADLINAWPGPQQDP